MLEINDLNIKIDDRYLVKNLSFTLNYGDKFAIKNFKRNKSNCY